MKEKIEKEIKTRKEIYIKSPSDMVSAFDREVKTEKEYNGRQLLELLQNADDEQSKEVRIELDTTKSTLAISNRGEGCTPFSYKGIRSLMISNLSPKKSKKYIGNKGLGFRSIINWSEKISINSNDLRIEFSRKIVNKVFDEMFTTKQGNEIREEEQFSESVYPIPFLSIPRVSDSVNGDWTTRIEINYKPKFLGDIEKQIGDLKDEVLLFLNSILRLDIFIDGDIRQVNKEDLSKQWTIYFKTDKLPKELQEYRDPENEEEHYDLKIALQDDLTCDIREIFAYFPTEVAIDFPFIVHGTFELNSSRNGIISNPKNEFILLKLVDLIVSTAKEIAKDEDEVSFKALEMLSCSNRNPILSKLRFYEAIDSAIETEEIFPCLDGEYRCQSEVVFSDSLSTFVQEIKKEHLFENLIIPLGNFDPVAFKEFDVETSVNIKKLNDLSESIDGIEERVSMIYMFYHSFSHEHKLGFLIDDQSEIISLENDVYTPPAWSFSIPDYVDIKFIHRDLFEQLVIKFEINLNDKARELKKKLEVITNIQSYEPAPVLGKIVASTNKRLKKDEVDEPGIINKMVSSLYQNYLELSETSIPAGTKVQLINKNGTLSDAKDLYLSKSYPSGELTEFLFKDVFSDGDYLDDVSSFGLPGVDLKNVEELERVEEFFLWLGVNKYTKIIQHKNIRENEDYRKFVFKHESIDDRYRKRCLFSYKEIARFSKIVESLTPEKLVLWFHLDESIYKQLDNKKNDDIFQYNKSYVPLYLDQDKIEDKFRPPINKKPSYISYQIRSTRLFKDYFVGDDKLRPLINETAFNFEYEEFEKLGLSKSYIEEDILIKFGAVDKFEDLSIEAVNRIINELYITSSGGKQSEAIYRHCIKHFELHKQPLDSPDRRLFAKKDDEENYFPYGEVFYNGNIKLPKRIISSKAILNYPKRQSTSNVIEFFGINDLSLDIEVKEESIILASLSEEFASFLEKITLYILVYRIRDKTEDKKAQIELDKWKKIHIEICDSVHYTFDGDNFELDDNDYVRDRNNYFIKVNEALSLEKLSHELEFLDCFADIMGQVFDLQETQIYKDIMVKDEVPYIEKTITNDIGKGELIRAKGLLGISDEKDSFWRTIYTLVGRGDKFDSSDNLEKVKQDLKIKTDITGIDYANLQSLDSCKNIIPLFKELELEIKIVQFNNCEHSYYEIDFIKFHESKLKQDFESTLDDFKKKLYSWCVENSEEKRFTTYIYQYENNEEFISSTAKENEFILTFNYNDKVEEFVAKKFDLQESLPTGNDFMSIHSENENTIKTADLDGNREYLSLLYFPDKMDEVREYIKSQKRKSEAESSNRTEEPSAPIKEIKEARLGKPEPPGSSEFRVKKPYIHSALNDARKKATGKKSEQYAFNSLVNKFGQSKVDWTSKNDDSCGYDIKYINGSGITKYVEVKTHSGDSFHISKNEIKFAQSHQGDYEIFLVGDEITKIADIDFEDEDDFILEAQEFLVFCTPEKVVSGFI